jgi:membrane protein, antimicrobial resistance system
MTDYQTAAPPAPVEEPPKSGVARLTGVLFSPDETFRDIARKPNVLLPLMIFLVVSAVSGILLAPRLQFESVRTKMERSNPSLSQADMDRAVKMAGAVGKMFSYAAPVLSVVVFLIVTGVILIAFRLFGGEGGFKQAFSVVLHSWIPQMVQSIILTGVVLSKGTMDVADLPVAVASNLAILVDMNDHPVLFSFLSSMDLFTIWSVVLLIIGFAHVARVTKAKSATIVLSLWAVLLFFKVGFAALGALRMKAS